MSLTLIAMRKSFINSSMFSFSFIIAFFKTIKKIFPFYIYENRCYRFYAFIPEILALIGNHFQEKY